MSTAATVAEQTQNPQAAHAPDEVQWSLATRVVYRMVAVWLFLYTFRTLNATFFFFNWRWTKIFPEPMDLADHIAPWVYRHIFLVREPLLGGSSEAVLVDHFVFLLFAAVCGLLWSAIDRKRPNYRVLDQWLRLWVCLVLAGLMFIYGFGKFFPLQFGHITRSDLVRPLGSYSPFRLMWRFMAASKWFTIFSGCMELLAGIMLLVPRLTNAGALLYLIVMTNIAVMDISYNVVLKVLPVNLVLVGLYLCAPLFPRLADVLVFSRAVPSQVPVPLSSRRSIDLGARIAQAVLGAIFFCICFATCKQWYAERVRAYAAHVPLQGIWQVDQFAVAGDSPSPIFTPRQVATLHLGPGDERWSRLIFDEADAITIQTTNGEVDDFDLKLDKSLGIADLIDDDDKSWKCHLTIAQPQPDKLRVKGQVNGASIDVTLHRVDEASFPLRDDGLHLLHWR